MAVVTICSDFGTLMAYRGQKNGNSERLFPWSPKSLWMVTATMEFRRLLLGGKAMTNLESILKKQRHYFTNKGLYGQGYGFSSNHVWMWQLDHKEGWALKNCFFPTVVLEKTLESPLDCKEIQPVHPKGNQYWSFIGTTDAEAPICWPPYMKSLLIGKDPDAEKDRWQEKGMTEDQVVGWHHQLNEHEFEQALGDAEGQ